MNFQQASRTWLIAAAAGALLLGGCAASRQVQYEQVALERAQGAVAENARLDVGIVVFDPGLAENGDGDPKNFVFPEVRRAEARYMAYHLKSTLEATSHWGSVWVLPERSDAVDVLVWGRVDRSNGLEVKLRVGAWDATGKEWLNKTYDTRVPEKAYSKYRDLTQDPYQNVYNEIANDLLAARNKLSDGNLVEVRRVAEMRYAADLVPAAFEETLAQGRDGIYELKRLPAEDDPMLARMRAVREREYLLVDTLNEYYASLYYDLSTPYEDWRKMSREETLRYQELKRSARMRQLLGLAAIVGAIAYEGSGGDNSAITMTGIIGGVEGLKSGFGKAAEADIHRESIRELGASFESEAEPVVVEIEGQTRRLTGTAEEKYKEWRRLLHEIYTAETGITGDQALPPPESTSAVSPN